MRALLAYIAIAAATCVTPATHAQPYPVKPVRYVVPFATGDGPDPVSYTHLTLPTIYSV